MRNLLFRISFDGSAFHGWQMQKNARTVQGELTDAFRRLTGEDVVLHGCSRTDAGVHANEFYFNVKTDSSIPVDNFPKALMSSRLPGEISVFSCREVDEDFNARFSCLKKEYIYKIENREERSPFLYKKAYNYPYRIDVDSLNETAKSFIGTFDFSAFCAAGSEVKSKIRTIYSASVTREDDFVIFRVCGDGFLYNMVRIMAGTLIYTANGKLKASDIPDIIESRDRTRAGITLVPDGLYLNKVFYGSETDET